MEKVSDGAQGDELSLELTLAVAAPVNVFFCSYCYSRFRSSQALGGHQNAHKHERRLAKHRREIASPAAKRARRVSSVFAAWKAAAGRVPGELAGGNGMAHKRGRSAPERADEVDLSLRL